MICVSIMLNCLLAFFVGAFVAEIDGRGIGSQVPVVFTRQKKLVCLAKPGNSEMSNTTLSDENRCSDVDSLEFDVYEREGFESILRTVSGGTDDVEAYAQEVCAMLEVFQNLHPRFSQIGYLVYCQQALNSFSTKRFDILTKPFLEIHQVHAVVNDLHERLLMDNENAVQCDFARNGSKLRLAGSLLRHKPSISIIAAEIETN